MNGYSNELMHYGVLGMKWGKRKARKYNEKAASLRKNARGLVNGPNKTRSDRATKAIGKVHAARQREKANEYEQKAKKLESQGGFNKKTKTRVEKMSTGKAVAQSVLMGSYGAAVYNNIRANSSTSRGKAVGQAILANWTNNITFGSLSRATKRGRLKG